MNGVDDKLAELLPLLYVCGLLWLQSIFSRSYEGMSVD